MQDITRLVQTVSYNPALSLLLQRLPHQNNYKYISIEDSFHSTAYDIEADKSKIWKSLEVFELYLSHGGEECSHTSLVPKLAGYFASDFLVPNGTWVASLSVFRSKASLRLVQRQDDDDDIVGLLEAVGHQLFSETKELIPNKTTYHHASIHLYLGLDCVSPTLLGLQAKLSKKTEAYCARCNHWEILCVAW